MGIGSSVFLVAIGAILAFAIRDTNLGGVVDLHVVGWIVMLAGIVGLIVTLTVFGRRRRTTVVERPGPTRYERQVVDDGPPDVY